MLTTYSWLKAMASQVKCWC